MKRSLLASLAAVGLVFSSQAKTTDTTTLETDTTTLEKKATSLTATSTLQKKTVTLALATEDGGKTQKYLHYYKMTLKKGKAYTLWLTGDDAVDGKIRIRAAYGKESLDWNTNPPSAVFEKVDCGVETRFLVTGKKWESKDDWEDMDWAGLDGGGDINWGRVTTPSSWTYYIVVEGEKDTSAVLNYVAKNVIPYGVQVKPLVLTAKNAIQTTALKSGFMSSYYYVQLVCQKGYCYRFGAVGGDADNELSFVKGDFLNGTLADFGVWTNEFNGAVSFYSSKKQTLTFRLQSTKGYTAKGSIRYYVEKHKAITSHASTLLKVGRSVAAVPGYLNKPTEPAKGYFDLIADEQLFRIALKKGKHYVIETSGADPSVPIIAYLYDSKGTMLLKNSSKGSDSADVRIVCTPSKTAVYYVGVCEQHGPFDEFEPKYVPVTLSAAEVGTVTKTIRVLPVPATSEDLPKDKDEVGSPVLTFGTNCWYATAAFGATKNVTYAFSAEFTDPANVEANKLTVEIYKTKVASKYKVKTLTVEPGEVFSFVAGVSAMHYLVVYPTAGKGLDYKPFNFRSTGYYSNGTACGAIKVTLTGAKGKWAQIAYKSKSSFKTTALFKSDLAKRMKAAIRYDNGTSVIVPTGMKTVFFTDVKGYTKPASVTGTVNAGETWELKDLYYTDKWDPADDSSKKATALSITTKTKKVATHTLWKTDARDWFAFTAKQGYYYTFAINGGTGDQVFTLMRVDGEVVAGAEDVKSVSRILLPKTTNTRFKKTPAKYYLIVSHATDDNVGGKYTLAFRYENLGLIKFSKSTYTVNDSSTSVVLPVSRTGSKGAVRVHYKTVASSAKDGAQFIAKDGYLSWKDGEKSTKKITVKLIPKTLPLKGKNLAFKVALTDASQDEVDDGLPESKLIEAAFPGAKKAAVAVVTIANKAKYKSVKAAYASVYKDKKTTLKKQENVPLRSGTFYGLLSEEGNVLTNGAPKFGALTLTVTAGKKPENDKFSAKALVAGVTYAFSASDGWDGTNKVGRLVKTLRAASSADPSVTNELMVIASDGKTADWTTNSVCTAELKLYLPDAEGGQQAQYVSTLFRRNDKIQSYLNAAFKFDGYYTMTLVPDGLGEDESLGNGYLTVTVDAKGGAKVSGLLSDKSKVSATATACAVLPDSSSASKWKMLVPVFQSDANGCFVALLQLTMQADSGRVDGKSYKIVFKSSDCMVFWNRDDGVNQDGSRGWSRKFRSCGGWYDKLVNLQGYYNNLAQQFEAKSTGSFPPELLDEGYEIIAEPHASVNLAGNAFAAAKNACNVTVKFNRTTGVAAGTSSILTSNGELQTEVKGFTHFGVLTIDRDNECGLDPYTLIYGSLIKPVELEDGTWIFSIPFEIFAD